MKSPSSFWSIDDTLEQHDYVKLKSSMWSYLKSNRMRAPRTFERFSLDGTTWACPNHTWYEIGKKMEIRPNEKF